jgi:solute carrier family 35 protein
MSVSLVVVGCVVAGIGDLSFDGWGYMFAFASVVMQSVYLLLIEFKVRGAEIHVRGAECEGCYE